MAELSPMTESEIECLRLRTILAETRLELSRAKHYEDLWFKAFQKKRLEFDRFKRELKKRKSKP